MCLAIGEPTEPDIAIHSVQRFNQAKRLVDMVQDRLARIGPLANRTVHQGRQVIQRQPGADVVGLESGAKPIIGGITVRILADPPVEMDRRMERIRRVTDIVAQDPGVVDDALFDLASNLFVAFFPPEAKLQPHALEQFEYPVRRKSWKLTIADCTGELIPVTARKRPGRHDFKVEVVAGTVRSIERGIQVRLARVPPPVRFRVQINELIDCIPEELRHVLR